MISMNQGRHHVAITAVDGWDVLASHVLPERWYRRLIAVRVLRVWQRTRGTVLSMLRAKAEDITAEGYTFTWRGRAWHIVTTTGATKPFVAPGLSVVVPTS
ncbi:MAG: hypothetical protein KA310_03300 [Pseudomonadales bacterium]|nr:hypothetical protein [Pseudomonadales bacterium]